MLGWLSIVILGGGAVAAISWALNGGLWRNK